MKTILTLGCFDLMHAGHVDLFKKAKALGDCLVVAIASDALVRAFKGPDRPIFPLNQRMVLVGSCRFVDHITVYGTEHSTRETNADDQKEVFRVYDPDIFVEGEGSHVLPDWIEERGIERVRTSRLSAVEICTSHYIEKIEKNVRGEYAERVEATQKFLEQSGCETDKYYFPIGERHG